MLIGKRVAVKDRAYKYQEGVVLFVSTIDGDITVVVQDVDGNLNQIPVCYLKVVEETV